MYEMENVSPPIKVKIVVPHGGIQQTNFMATAAKQSQVDGSNDKHEILRAQYEPFVQKTMERLRAMATQGMPASEVGAKIFEASTDDDTTKLRYFVSPTDGGQNLRDRMDPSGSGEDFDEIDRQYVERMKNRFVY